MSRLSDELTKELRRYRNVLLLGYGLEGRSTHRFLRERAPDVAVTVADAREALDAGGAATILGPDYARALKGPFDLIVKSPGVPVRKLVDNPDALPLTSQTDLFLKFYRERTTGVTGTKGKSTLTTLIAAVRAAAAEKVFALGNIGAPPFDVADALTPDATAVFELSCHQLERVAYAPKIAILLNLYQEHLDYYGDLESYFAAKLNIGARQDADATLIFNADDANIHRYSPRLLAFPGKKMTISRRPSEFPGAWLDAGAVMVRSDIDAVPIRVLDLKDAPPFLHVYSLMATALVESLRGTSPPTIAAAVRDFRSLPHRLEAIGERDGVQYYNDSISTTPESTMFGVEALGGADTLLIGGMDRGIDYRAFAVWLARETKVANIVLMYETGARIGAILKAAGEGAGRVAVVADLNEAVAIARKRTPRGGRCLLSPAAPSFGAFADYRDRGETFKKLVFEK